MLSERAQRIKPSATLAIDVRVKSMKAQGIDVLNFGLGEPDFDTPEHVKAAAIKAIRDGFTKYTAVGGIDELKEAIIKKLSLDNNVDYAKEDVIVSCGAKHSLYNIAQALFNPGDEIIIPAPYWVSYPDQALLNDAVPVFIPTDETDNFMLCPDELESQITGRTKALILNSPSNPTGSAYDEKTLEAIAEIVVRRNIFVISDEIYEKLVYDGARHISISSLGSEIKKKTILVNGLSKSHAMTGWRIGYAAGPMGLIKAMTGIQSQSTSNPTSIAQKAAVAALTGPQDSVSAMRSEFDIRRKAIVKGLNAIEGVSCLYPSGAFYAFPNVSSFYGRSAGARRINSSLDMATYLLEEAHVALVHGEAFGDDRYIRISYATSMDVINKGLERMRDALSRLK